MRHDKRKNIKHMVEGKKCKNKIYMHKDDNFNEFWNIRVLEVCNKKTKSVY